MRNKRLSFKTIIDYVYVILQISYHLSIIGSLTFDLLPLPSYLSLFLLSFFLHTIRFGIVKYGFWAFCCKSLLIIVLAFIYLVDSVQNFLLFGTGGTIFLQFLNMILFISYLYNLYKERNNSIEGVINPYLAYSFYCIIGIIILLILLLGGMSYELNELPSDLALLQDNAEDRFIKYYFPFYLSIVSDYHPMIGFPVLTGLSHEPHVIMYLLIPSYFFYIYRITKDRYQWIISLVFIVLLIETLSTTAILIFSSVVFVNAIWNSYKYHNYTILFGCAIVAFLIISILGDYLELASTMINSKINNEDDSGGTSLSMVGYLLSTDDLLGMGNYPQGYGLELSRKTAGIIVGYSDMAFFALLFYKSLKLSLNSTPCIHYIGLGCLYFTLHTIKINYLAFRCPYMLFIVAVISLIENTRYSLSTKEIKL